MKTRPIPTKPVPDWQTVADFVLSAGPWLAPATLNPNAAHAALHKRGIGVYSVRVGGQVVAYSIEPLRGKL